MMAAAAMIWKAIMVVPVAITPPVDPAVRLTGIMGRGELLTKCAAGSRVRQRG